MRFLNAKWDQSRINRHSFAIRPRAGRNGNIFANRFNRSVLEDDRSVGDHGAMPGGRPPKWAPALLFSRRPAGRKVSGIGLQLVLKSSRKRKSAAMKNEKNRGSGRFHRLFYAIPTGLAVKSISRTAPSWNCSDNGPLRMLCFVPGPILGAANKLTILSRQKDLRG